MQNNNNKKKQNSFFFTYSEAEKEERRKSSRIPAVFLYFQFLQKIDWLFIFWTVL